MGEGLVFFFDEKFERRIGKLQIISVPYKEITKKWKEEAESILYLEMKEWKRKDIFLKSKKCLFLFAEWIFNRI